jgi:hypothetical protein
MLLVIYDLIPGLRVVILRSTSARLGYPQIQNGLSDIVSRLIWFALFKHVCDSADHRRSSARSRPRTSVGKCGSIHAHCSSLSQNRFLLINPSLNTNQYRIVEAQRLMSSDRSFPLRSFATLLIKRVADLCQCTVICPQITVVVDRAFQRQVFRNRAPLTAGRENVHEAVHHPRMITVRLTRRDQWFDQFAFVVGQITRISQLAAIVTGAGK